MSKGKYIKPSCKQHVGAGYYIDEKRVARCNYCSEKIITTSLALPHKNQSWTPNPHYAIKSGNHAGERIINVVRENMTWALHCISMFEEDSFMYQSIMVAINMVNREKGNGKSFRG